MKKFRIFTRLFFTHTIIGLVSVVSLSVIFYFIFLNALLQRTTDQLSSINILKKNHIEQYLNETQKNLELHFGQKKIKEEELINLGEELSEIKQLYDLKSILVTDSQWKRIVSLAPDSLLIEVVAHYRQQQPSDQKFQIIEAASFLAIDHTIPVYVIRLFDDSTVSGYVFIEDDFATVQKILEETTGMGNTGESYLVGSDLKMRSRSRFDPSREPLTINVKTIAMQDALAGRDGSGVIKDYRGTDVLTVYRKVNSPHLNWTLISEIDYDEAMMPMKEWRNYFSLASIFIMVVILAITFFISNAISRPILRLRKIITQLSKGTIPHERARLDDASELGQIGDSIDELILALQRTTLFANKIGAGEFNTPYTPLSDQDTLGNALIEMRDKLKKFSAEQARLIREKASALLEGQENERKRIIQDLHDGVGQLLTAVRLRVQMLEKEDALREELMKLVNDTILEIRRISYNVMPNALVDFGLEAALRGLCDHVMKYTSMTVDFNFVREFEHTLSFDISIAVFRIVQEGFNNIMKHSGATHADLYVLDREDQLYLILKDNGVGFDESASRSGGFGLRNMRERIKLLNGAMELHTAPGQGTTIELTIPTSTDKNHE